MHLLDEARINFTRSRSFGSLKEAKSAIYKSKTSKGKKLKKHVRKTIESLNLDWVEREDLKKISVAFPTRGRSEICLDAITNCLELAKYPSTIQFVLAIDDDDQKHNTVIYEFMEKNPKIDIRIISKPRREFKDFSMYTNDLASASTGYWFFMYNDDLFIETKEWDEVVRSLDDNRIYQPATPNFEKKKKKKLPKNFIANPLIPKTWMDALGKVVYEKDPWADKWLMDLTKKLNCRVHLQELHLYNRRFKESGDAYLNDKTFKDRQSRSNQYKRRRDRDKSHLGGIGSQERAESLLEAYNALKKLFRKRP